MSKRLISVASFSILKQTIALVGSLAIACGKNPVYAQINPDNTLGSEGSVVTPDVEIKGETGDRIDGGAIRGANLFHSFQQFNIGNEQRVYFANPAGIENILSRVTGNDISDILGTLGVNGSANLFLLNPNGIIFGENAKLDVGGSFIGSTASAIQFGDDTQFSANASQTTPLLTVNIPIGLQFGSNAKSIQVQGNGQGLRSTPEIIDTTVGLRVKPNQTLALVGGDIALKGGTIKTAGGRIELGSVTEPGLVSLNTTDRGLSFSYEGVPTFGDIELSQQAAVDASGEGGGNIQIRGRRVTLKEGSQVEASTLKAKPGGTLNVSASEAVELIGPSAVGQFSTALGAQVYPDATGTGGNLTLETGRLILQDGAQISSNTLGSGAGGFIEIRASDSVELIGKEVVDRFATTLSAQVTPEATGVGGDITIETKKLSVSNSQVGTVTIGKGNAGNLTVRASDSVEVSGKILIDNIENPAGLLAQVNVTGEGKSGNLNIETGRLSVSNGGKVQVATFGQGDAGNLMIRASEVEVFDTSGENLFATGINAGVEVDPDETVTPPKGNGGNLTIESDRLSIRGGATVSVATAGEGNAGTLRILAPEFVEVLGKSPNGNFKSQVTAEVTPDAIGSGGNLSIEAGQMIIRDGAEAIVSSKGIGNAGNLEIKADSIRLDNQGQILAETASGNGGNITLQSQDLLLLRRNSKISTTAGTSQAGGDGGSITIDTPFIVAFPSENSDITANAFTGRGGRVTIDTQGIFGTQLRSQPTPNSDITASSDFGLSGVVEINTPDLEPSQQQIELPTEIVNVAGLINQNLCTVGQGSEFILTGRGGLPNSPKDLLNAEPGWEDWRIEREQISSPSITSIHSDRANNTNNKSQKIVEANGWVIVPNGNVILTAQASNLTSYNSGLRQDGCQKK